MKSWNCSTDTVAERDRERIWGEALHRIALPGTSLQDPDGFHGDVCSIVSPLGIEFSRVSASAQTISGKCAGGVPSLWLALPVKGRFLFDDGADGSDLRPGDILYGPAGCDSTLRLPNTFVMLYVRIPLAMLHPRLLNLRIMPTGRLSSHAAVNRAFSSLLNSVVDDLDELTDDDIRPIEVALSEFVISSLGASAAAGRLDAAAASNFHRICQAIELHLGDGELTLARIADEQHVSGRYIQKLFQQAGLSFSPYLRQRRLAHCRSDLANTALRNLSISEICFRWGFNDAGHFSRSFRAEYGETPREFRQSKKAVLF